MKIMRSIKGISVFLTLAVSLLASTIGAQAQISSGAPTKLVLINSFNDFASVQPAQNQNSVVVVRYGNTVGDQLGGMFAYDPDSVAAGDSKNVFVPASGVGRFVRYDYAAYVPGVNTANRVLVTDGSGNVGTDPQLTFNGADLTVGGNLTVTTIGAGSTDNIVTKSAGNVLQTRQVNPDVWNLAADLAGDSENLAAGTKLTSPAIYFDGSNDYIEVADSDKLSFQTATGSYQGTWSAATNTPFLTDGVGTSTHYYVVTAAGTQNLGSGAITYAIGDTIKYDGSIWSLQQKDDLPFSISAWVKMRDATNFVVASKYGASSPLLEWLMYVNASDKLALIVQGTSGAFESQTSTSALTSYEGEWVHVAACYGGSGPNSGSAFTSAADEITLYINGQAIAMTEVSGGGTYAGMSDTSQAVWIGRQAGTYSKGHIKNVQIFNRELTATEVAQLAKGNDLGYADEWAGALGGVYTQDSTPSGEFTASGGAESDLAGPLVGKSDVLRFTCDGSSGTHSVYTTSILLSAGKRYRVSGYIHIPSGQSNIDGFVVVIGTSPVSNLVASNASPTLDVWTFFSGEVIGAGDGRVRVFASDGGATGFTDAGSDDTFEVAEITVTEIGTLADFRAENFDSDTGKLYDLSTNAYVGVNSGAVITGRSYPVYETGTWTPGITFGGGATGMTFGTQEGYYTREGNQVTVHAYVVLTAKGSDTGTALMTGLPFTARNTAGSSQSFSVGNMANAASLTSPVTAYATDNGTTINLVDWGATGSAVLDNTNFTDTTAISVTGSFQVQ